jgi:hypothetical protein
MSQIEKEYTGYDHFKAHRQQIEALAGDQGGACFAGFQKGQPGGWPFLFGIGAVAKDSRTF